METKVITGTGRSYAPILPNPFGGDYIFMIQNFPILAFLQQQRKVTVSLERQYESDYFFVTAQTGLKFAGVSPLLATQSIVPPEFPLPLWCVIHILLTHPERFANWDILGIYCAGDLVGDSVFGVPYIRRIFDGRIVIETGAKAEGILGVATTSYNRFRWERNDNIAFPFPTSKLNCFRICNNIVTFRSVVNMNVRKFGILPLKVNTYVTSAVITLAICP